MSGRRATPAAPSATAASSSSTRTLSSSSPERERSSRAERDRVRDRPQGRSRRGWRHRAFCGVGGPSPLPLSHSGPVRERGSAPCAGRPTRPKLRPCFARRPRLRAPHVNDREDTMLHRAPLGALAAGLLMLSGTALAQQPAAPAAGGAAPAAGAAAPAAPPAPGSALYGRPESE